MKVEATKQNISESTNTIEGLELLKLAAKALLEKKAQRIVAFDLTDQYLYTDYIIITQGSSDRHVRTIADGLLEMMKQNHIEPLGVEGYNAGQWILVDLNDVVVHIFLQDVRTFYDLEGIWSRMPSIDIYDLLGEADDKDSNEQS